MDLNHSSWSQQSQVSTCCGGQSARERSPNVGRLIMNDPTQVAMILLQLELFFEIVYDYILVCCSRYVS